MIFKDKKKRDPYRNFNFHVYLGAQAAKPAAACKKCSGLTASVEVVKFRAGASTSTVDQALPGRVSYEPITLESGISEDPEFKTWANTLIRHEASKYPRNTDPNFRRTVRILVFDVDNNPKKPVKKYELHQAWVSKYTALSDLAADANEVLIETLEIQHEGFTEITVTT